MIYTVSGVEAVTGAVSADVNKVYPNPFNPSTTVEFPPKAGPGSVRIFDPREKGRSWVRGRVPGAVERKVR